MKRYEGMFLFDNATMHQWSEIDAEVRRLCDRIGAELLVCLKFDERKLAYEVDKRKRGTYVLTYFDADPNRIVDLERDVQLNEVVLRVLVLRADSLKEERLAELKALPPDQSLQPASAEGRRGEGGPYRGRGPSRPDREGGESSPRRDAPPAAGAATQTTDKDSKPATAGAATQTTDKDSKPAAAGGDGGAKTETAPEKPAAPETPASD